MPTSQWQQITPIIGMVLDLAPTSILDVGMGNGKYGFLCREYLDLAKVDANAVYGQRKTVIHGIEAFEPYISTVQRDVYDRIFIGDAREIIPSLSEDYDLVLMIDVLEHFDLDDAVMLVRNIQRIGKHMIISVPAVRWPQDAMFGNDYERHRHSFSVDELRSLGFQVLMNIGGSWVGVWGPRSREFHKKPWWWRALAPVGRLLPAGIRERLVATLRKRLW